jgi:choline dehydrogenase
MTEAEVIVVGGGTAGAVVAARLAEAGADVLVLEAGPDPGPFGDPRWPADLLDAAALGTSYDWGFSGPGMAFERARVLGGCSAHNGAVQTWGHRADYDRWDLPGWGADDLLALFERSSAQQRVRTYAVDELTPFQAAWHEAGPSVGLPRLAHTNDLDETVGVAPESVNIVEGVRWNTAFSYLDPVRDRLRIAGGMLVDRVVVEGGRATGVVVAGETIHAGLVVVAGGTYCSPAVLLRSGIGPAGDLRALGIDVVADLPVGENLHDQPFALLRWEGSPELERAMSAAAAQRWTPDEQVMAKAASSADAGVFDLHVMPFSPTEDGERRWCAGVAALVPRSRGRVWLLDRDPAVLPGVDHRFLSDPEGHDVAVLAEGVGLLRELAAVPELARLLGGEVGRGGLDVPSHLRANPDNYWHPVGTCAMGAVTDERGRVHGVDGLVVADASLMPVVPRATTHMPTTVIGERVAACLVEDRDRPERW